LPKHQPYDYTIDLEEKAQPPFGPIYNLSQDKFATLHEDINKNVEKGFTPTFQISSWCPYSLCQKER